MTQVSFPDWQRYLIPGGNLVFQDSPSAAVGYGSGQQDVSQWSNILINFQNLDHNVSLWFQVVWTGFQTVVATQFAQNFTVGPQQIGRISLPVLDRTMALNGQPVVGVPTLGIVYGIYGSQRPVSKYDAKYLSSALVSDGSAYAAGGSKLISAAYWYEGPATVTIFTDLNNAAWVQVEYYEANTNGWNVLAVVKAQSWPFSLPMVVGIPAAPIRANVQNQGGAQNIVVSIIPAAT